MFSLHACSVSCTSGVRSKLNNQKRNCIATKKEGNTTSPFQPRRFLPQIVSCSEKRRRPEAGVRFECVKPVYRNRALQNGKFSNIEVSPQQGGLYDKFRPHRRLPDGSHASRLPKISSFSVGGQNLRIYSNAIRPKCGPQAVYKNHVASLRSQGVRLIIYIDDILIIASSIETLNRHKTLAISLLESLGFLINYEKSNLTPSQQIVFLGMLVDSASMQFILPQQKAVQIQKECRLLLNTNRPTIRHLSRVLGLLEACRPAVWSAPLHYRELQTLRWI